MPTTLTNGIQLPDKGSVDWYNSMQSNYNLIDTHLGNTDTHVTAEDKANWNSKQGSLSQAQLDAIAQVSTNTSDITALQSGKANASHTHSSSDITDIGDYATKQYVDNSISGLVDSAPNALDTLNELAAALNDDANFASTVATALSAKANSADLATVATSGSYNDLSNKPSIPTKTSDLTNDSNFVDTSNSAVASGITAAKVTSYDSHVADTDIHVTTADKTKWNTIALVKQLRLVNIQVGSATTIAFSNIDDTNGIKVGDKCMDLDGRMFEITAVDTTNQTVTVGTALIDLALDANVVHTNRNNDVSIPLNSTFAELGVTGGSTNVTFLDKNDKKLSGLTFGNYVSSKLSYVRLSIFDKDANDNEIQDVLEYSYVSNNANAYLRVYRDNFCTLGSSSYRWKGVYATNYYYGANNIEFSTKFVTTDTAQTITETKTFTNTIKSQKEIEFTGNRSAYILPEFSASYSGLSLCTYGSSGAVKIGSWKVADNDNTKHVLDTSLGYLNVTTGSVNSVNSVHLTPRNTTDSKLGDSTNKWKEINGLTPSSLSMPDLNNSIDISGYITDLTGSPNVYSPPANGYIVLRSTTANVLGIVENTTGMGSYSRGSNQVLAVNLPVVKNSSISIYAICSSLTHAKFIPCQGNV